MLTVLGIIILDSWTLAALTRTASGMPWTSTTRWRFVLCLPRSVGFLAVSWPLDRSRGGVQGSLQSMRSAWASSSSGTWCKRRQTSALYQSHIPSRQASFKEDTGLQHEQDSRELRPVQHRGSPTPRFGRFWTAIQSDRHQVLERSSRIAIARMSIALKRKVTKIQVLIVRTPPLCPDATRSSSPCQKSVVS
jgi:hypothetical protein